MNIGSFPNYKNSDEARESLLGSEFLIHSLLDNDMYKFTMMQYAFHNQRDAKVKYRFKCRSKTNLLHLKEMVIHQIKHYCNLSFSQDELDFMSQVEGELFKSDFIEFLRNFKHNFNDVNVFEEDGDLAIEINGSWVGTILMEVPFLAIINGCQTILDASDKEGLHYYIQNGLDILNEKIHKINLFQYQYPDKLKIVEFGVRRRFLNFEYQKLLNQKLLESAPQNYMGASNMLLAKELGVKPYGTMAHEYLQAAQAISTPEKSQQFAFESWKQEYGDKLLVALSDIFGNEAFFADFGKELAEQYFGLRQDSGCPFKWGNQAINFYNYHDINPSEKTIMFSDSLNIDKCIALTKEFSDRINVLCGIGTNITNDVGLNALSIVLKMVEFNGQSVAKISNNVEKIMSRDEKYLESLFSMIDRKKLDNAELLNYINQEK